MNINNTKKNQKKAEKIEKVEKNGKKELKNKKEFTFEFGIGGNFFVILVMLLALVILGPKLSSLDQKKPFEVPFSEVARGVSSGEVSRIEITGNVIDVTKKDQTHQKSKKESDSSLSDSLRNLGVSPEALGKTEIVQREVSGFMYWLITLAPILLPLIFIGLLVWSLSKGVKGAGMQAFTFGQSKAKITNPDDTKNRVTFLDVAGAREAKEELAEIVDFLRNPAKFIEMGAQIPKGVLLAGSPGTGKTLLARAVAGEAGVPFFYLSGSDFIEMFVGVGASRVRDLFLQAKKVSPSIIFIDEIDAIGRTRGGGHGGGNDEREQTLNQILVEMDGFDPSQSVIVMAATNRADVLDPALLRPGRFDRRVILDLPDKRDRKEILAIHARKKPLAASVDLTVVAERTPGFSGADLYSLMNEAAIMAARQDRKEIIQSDVVQSIEKVMLGPERKSHLVGPEEKRLVAYHEAGHALLASLLPHADPVHKISIIARGRAGGYTLTLPNDETKLQSKYEFLDTIIMSLGGYVAEEMVLGTITTGPSNDLQVSTARARAMVTRYGMSDLVGPIALDTDGGRPIAFSGDGIESRRHSAETEALVDSEVKRIMIESLEKARTLLKDNRAVLEAIAEKLIEVEILEEEDYNALIREKGIVVKNRESL